MHMHSIPFRYRMTTLPFSLRISHIVFASLYSLSVLSYLLATSTWITSLTLPCALLQMYIQTLSCLVVCIAWVWYKKPMVLLAILWPLYVIQSEYAIHTNISIPKPEHTVHVLTWNVAGLQTSSLQCVTAFLQQWKEEHPRNILFFQETEVSQGTNQENTMEKLLDMHCFWSSYTEKGKKGIMVCADKDWKFGLEQQRHFTAESSYGFLQIELTDTHSKQKLNTLNVHLQSLYNTLHTLPTEIRSALHAHSSRSVSQFAQNNPNPLLALRIFKENTTQQSEQIEKIFSITEQLRDPTLIMGDFNSPPYLWFHRKMRSQLQDAHQNTGWGFGYTTERLKVLWNRIDYMYASSALQWVGQTKTFPTVTCSDHSPVASFLEFSKPLK